MQSLFLTVALLAHAFSIASLGEDMDMDHSHQANRSQSIPPMYVSSGEAQCSEMMVWDVAMGMCMPLPMAGMPMRMLMLHGNLFATGITEQGPRGKTALALPHMFMIDLGTSIGDRQYLNVDLMGTFERWTIPETGYPELLQIGEHDSQGRPFLDAQHPHSSPIMGLTLSDTIRLGEGRNYLKLSFAPRGESTDGPIAFMHRPTGMANPDAPLGHHIGQDVGHISSTVIGASLRLGGSRFEASVFHGAEPEPSKVDLPVGTPDSIAFRFIQELSPSILAMASYAYVQSPEPDDPTIAFLSRYSASVYTQNPLWEGWTFYNAFIFGLVANYDHVATLVSFAEEFWLRGDRSRIWGRLELVQRTGTELQIPSLSEPSSARWVAAATLGYTHALVALDFGELALGSSVTASFIPSDFSAAYGGSTLWSAKAFLQVTGMKMWDL